jgi:Uma2 family endonuclease
VIDPDQPKVEVYRPEDSEWTWRVYGPGAVVTVGELQLDVDQLYAWVSAHS